MPIDTCVEKVDVFLAAKGLPKIAAHEPEAFAVLFLKNEKSQEVVRIGNTPAIRDQPNPVWSVPISVDYMFEMRQEVVIKVYHNNTGMSINDLSLHTFIGESKFTLASLLATKDKKLTPSLIGDRYQQGSLMVRAEAQANTKDLFCVTFKGAKLANKDGFFGASDPFLVISRMNEDGSYTVVWKSAKIDNTLNPTWVPAKIPMTTLCNGDLLRPLRIEVVDWESSGKHQPMGQIETCVQRLLDAQGASFEVIEQEKVGKKGYTSSGQLSAQACSIERPVDVPAGGIHPTLADYIVHGCEISLITAIDFTGSNLVHTDPKSLHYMGNPDVPNPYQATIQAVGNILAPYDHDQMYPVYGFGAQLLKEDGKTYTEVSHCFPVHKGGLEVHGIEGILQAYKECAPTLKFLGPTYFAPLIEAATAIASNSHCCQEKQKYTILLIITDGAIHDHAATKAAIISASCQPMSIIIVGVGTADFKGMDALDSDKELLSAGGKTATRDIVQFVAHHGQEYQELARGLLAEVPDQFKQYMEMHGIRPNKA